MGAEGSIKGSSPRRGRGRPRGADSAETRAKIISAAQRLFADRGYDGASMDMLAGEVGLNTAATYYYFPSKRALFTAVTEAATERFLDTVRAHVLPADRLTDSLHGYLQAFRALHAQDLQSLRFLAVASREADVARHRTRHQSLPVAEYDAAILPLSRLLSGVLSGAVTSGQLPPTMDLATAEALFEGFANIVMHTLLLHPDQFGGVLDGLQLVIEGTLFRPDLR